MIVEKTISMGNILTLGTMVFLAAGSYFSLQHQVLANDKITKHNQQTIYELTKDLRTVQQSLVRIETNQDYIKQAVLQMSNGK